MSLSRLGGIEGVGGVVRGILIGMALVVVGLGFVLIQVRSSGEGGSVHGLRLRRTNRLSFVFSGDCDRVPVWEYWRLRLLTTNWLELSLDVGTGA